MEINTATLTLKTDKPVTEQATKLRGYIGDKFKDKILLHNHYDKETYLYSYPLVQYQIINQTPVILGIEEGINTIKQISGQLDKLELTRNYKITEKIIHEKTWQVRNTREEHKYQFITPWIALNEKNYKKYKQLDNTRDKKILLNDILIGNILSMCKGLGIIANHRIHMKSYLNTTNIKYKSVIMNAFTGEFTTNFKLPDYTGLGKGVSHGYGTIKEVDKKWWQ